MVQGGTEVVPGMVMTRGEGGGWRGGEEAWRW